MDKVNSYKLRIESALEYLDNNIDSDLSLQALSKIAGFSPYHFHRIFHAITGTSLHEYVLTRKLNIAASQLLYENCDITKIALDSGFSTPSAFSKNFKKLFGCTPTQYKAYKERKCPVKFAKISFPKYTYDSLIDKCFYETSLSDLKTLEDIDFLFNIITNKSMLLPSTYSNNSIKIIYTENSSGLPLSEDYKYVYNEYINKLKRNFEVKKITQDEFDFSKARHCFLKLIYGNMSISMPHIIRLLLKFKISSKLKDYLLAEEIRERCIDQLDSLFDNYDILISPVTVTPAFKHKNPMKTRGYQSIYTDMLVDGKKVSYATANMGYTTPFSLTSSPVIVIPIGKSKEGLPIGVQIVGRRFHDLDLKKIVTILKQTI